MKPSMTRGGLVSAPERGSSHYRLFTTIRAQPYSIPLIAPGLRKRTIEALQANPERHTEAVRDDARQQIYKLQDFLGRSNRDLVVFASAGLDYDSLRADWDSIWNDQMMTWVACEHGKPTYEGDRDAVPGSAAMNVFDLMAALRRSIAEDDKGEAESAPRPEKSKPTRVVASKRGR